MTGQAYGKTPRSFRSEAYGMLSYLRFLYHFKIFYQIECELRPFMICDNSGLLQRVSTVATEPTPRRCMYSEADVELQITDTLRQLRAEPTYVHVKSHPDPTIPVKKLPWKSQLNVRCDELASKKLLEIQEEPEVPILPASKIMLTIKGRSITHHQPAQIRREYSREKSREYLTYHHNWTNEFETIDWDLVHAKYNKIPFHKKNCSCRNG